MQKVAKKKPRKPRQNKREEIIQSSVKVLGHYGYKGASLDSIATDAGVSKTLIIKYYETKENLASVCIDRMLNNFSEKLDRLLNKKNVELDQFLTETFQLIKISRNEWQFLGGVRLTPALSSYSREINARNDENVRKVIEKYNDQIVEGEESSFAFLMKGLLSQYITTGDAESFHKAKEALFGCFIKNYKTSK